MSSGDADKPLPRIPHEQDLSVLTVDARAHIRRFILQALVEEGDVISLEDRDAWGSTLEHALLKLGDSILRGRWLAGIRRAQKIRKEHKDAEEAGPAHEKKEKEKADEDKTKGPRSKHSEHRRADDSASDIPEKPPSTASPSWCAGQRRDIALAQLRTLLARPLPRAVPVAQHLLLTVTTHGSRPRGGLEDAGFTFLRPALDCDFVAGELALPNGGAEATVLYGLEEWDTKLWSNRPDDIRIVGGTFRLKGVESASQYVSLCKVLRLSVYIYLSLLLEVHLLLNSHVEIRLYKATIPTVATMPLMDVTLSTQQDAKRRSKRDSASGLWSFVTKQTGNLLHRAVNVAPALARRGSLDLPSTKTVPSDGDGPPSVEGGYRRSRRFSLIGSPPWRGQRRPPDPSQNLPFLTVVEVIESSKDMLSTSPGVEFSPPRILRNLAEKEKSNPECKLMGDERAALSNVLGWEGKAAQARGMTGTLGFVRHQWISALYTEHVPVLLPNPQVPTPTSSRPSSSSSVRNTPRSAYCGSKRKWVTYKYYGGEPSGDECLGDVITRMCLTANDQCGVPGCQYKRAEHDFRWIHNGVRLVATMTPEDHSQEPAGAAKDNANVPRMWSRCSVCGAESRKQPMSDGTYLFSFGKYLELLIYSPAVLLLSPSLCEHTKASTPLAGSPARLPSTRLKILRKFSHQSRTVTFALSQIEDIFEVKVPRLQIVRSKHGKGTTESSSSSAQHDSFVEMSHVEDARRKLRIEIKQWWQGLAEYMDKLEENFVKDPGSTYHKRLPRLPSEDDAYDVYDGGGTITPRAPPGPLPTPSVKTPIVQSPKSDSYFTYGSDKLSTPRLASPAPPTPLSDPGVSSRSSGSSHSQDADSIYLLSSLRHAFQRTEQTLYTELSTTPVASLNDVRRSFITAAKGSMRRLLAWEAKHTSHFPKRQGDIGVPSVPEPEWWQSGCHAVPGGNVIVREDEWGSIIAFTLSSLDYHRELANMSASRLTVPSLPLPIPSPSAETRSSFFVAPSSLKRLIGSSTPQPDPDQEGIVWQEPESYSAVITRKEHPKDTTASLIALRGVLRQKASGDMSPTPASSKLALGTSPTSHSVPPSAFAKPAVEVSKQAVDGQLSGMPEAVEAAGKILHSMEASASPTTSVYGLPPDSQPSSSGFVETKIRRGKASSVMSSDNASTISAGSDTSRGITPPPLPPKNDDSTPDGDAHGLDRTTSPSTFTSTLTSSFANAMRYMLKPEVPRPPGVKSHHGLLSAESPAIDERPHIKYDWTIGKRLKFSCTVYYARQFDSLRRRCGIQDTFLQSLARSENWAADGGKSKSNFWKTIDDQFIIKTLVNAWNVADLHVLNELCPSYFRYMDSTASRPTVLAKLLGFYTIEVRNLETGTTQAKADLLVMENLFYNQKISRAFDLKGIQGRKVKASSSGGATSKTLFDGEWIEGQQRALTLVRPYSKVVFQEAIKADCDFLARSNIMDYSLLLGVNEDKKQIVCGLVDTIGSYTFAKTLEYKAKQGLNAGKEVTVVPPHEYQERFVSAMDEYFLACPDKWSRPLDGTKIPNDYTELPSVL
ncbi:hypothetical protein CERSUDRAFT_89288 [Gelatoporia subvermispora B]|uniref:PIPK domain-containing protein n=1 Tax=Ceriporiopsis subvermispora (strain B) TaxID=914234 RepID=M2Q2Z7_CERS8|nr:hypothetical protein CERSUDRAFT_89288 [Gelatoporia subvermispora B]